MRLAIRYPVGYLGVNDDAAWRRHGDQSSFRNYDRSAEYRRFLDHADTLLARERPHLRLSPLQRRRRLAGWLRYMALNAADRGDRRSSVAQLVEAVKTYPPSVLDPRLSAGFLALACGSSGRRALRVVRLRLRRLRVYGRP